MQDLYPQRYGYIGFPKKMTESGQISVKNGVKETKEISNISLMSEMFNVKAKQTIRDGVKG